MIAKIRELFFWEVRLKVAPASIRKVVFERASLASFSDKLGQHCYGDQWSSGLISARQSKRTAISEQHLAMRKDVVRQFTLALRAGLIEAQVELNLPPDPHSETYSDSASASGSDSDSDSDSDSYSGIDDEDGSYDGMISEDGGHYVICRSFWKSNWEEKVSDWNSSLMTVDVSTVLVSDRSALSAERGSMRPLLETKPYLVQLGQPKLTGKVYIKKIELAYDVVRGVLPTLTSIDADRYHGLTSRFRDELIAVAWREAAMEFIRSQRKRVRTSFFFQSMTNYMSVQEIDADEMGASDPSLKVICANMRNQFKNGDHLSKPFMNTNSFLKGPRKPSRSTK